MSDFPPLSDRAALDDAIWFGEHPQRCCRAHPASDGQIWLVRTRGRFFLRTLAQLPRVPVMESEIEVRWFAAAWPDLSPQERAALIWESLCNKKTEATR
jgi:hypothetical protein